MNSTFFYRPPLYLLFVILCLSGCSKSPPEREMNPASSAQKALKNQVESVLPDEHASRLSRAIQNALTEKYDPRRFQEQFGKEAESFSSSQAAVGTDTFFLGRPELGLRGVRLQTRDDRVAVVDMTFDQRDPNGPLLASVIAKEFRLVGTKETPVLDKELKEVNIVFEVLATSDSKTQMLRAQNGDVIRMIVVNPSEINIADVLPTSNTVRPELLDRARKLLNREKERRTGE